MEGSGKLEDASTFAVIGATIVDNFGLEMSDGTIGSSILKELK
jgi:phosphopentomutase